MKKLLPIFMVMVSLVSCAPKEYTVKQYINWNVLFTPTSSAVSREESMNQIERYIRDSIPSAIGAIVKGLDFRIDSIRRISCICDPLLVNITADIIIDSSGGAVKIPPPPPPGPGAEGSSVAYIDDNDNINVTSLDNPFSKEKIPIKTPTKTEKLILAIIDTGIDTTKFHSNLNGILWGAPGSLRNFLPGSNPFDFFDDCAGRHGSAVAGIVTQQFGKIYPSLMILKALDKNGVGSIFSVSCALSYAIENNADVINTSLGYYGSPDPILKSYIDLANYRSIGIVTAAGNTQGGHPVPLCRNSNNDGNHLTGSRLFFPACFSDDADNLITVTGLIDTLRPCFYQNFSDKYVSVGVMNVSVQPNCCAFQVPFLRNLIEGSSFATPVISGKIGLMVLSSGRRSNAKSYLDAIGVLKLPSGAASSSIKNGHYIKY